MDIEWNKFGVLFLAILAGAVGSHFLIQYLSSRSTAAAAPAQTDMTEPVTSADYIRQKYGDVVGV